MVGDPLPGYASWEETTKSQSDLPITDEERGVQMLYSSGTTGQPKGVLPKRVPGDPITVMTPTASALRAKFGFDENTVYLSPAPLYHAAPLTYNTLTMHSGGTSIIMERFDAEQSLALIQKYRVTHSQWVPIMFIRMLRLDESLRKSFDLSSHQVAVHAAAPCPVEIKRRMIDWWGPIINEYYGSTEGMGLTAINSQEWLKHPGSVSYTHLTLPTKA